MLKSSFATSIIFLCLELVCNAAPTVVFDSATGLGSTGSPGEIGLGAQWLGQSVTLSGSNRTVTDFAVAIGSGGPASFTAEFLLQDGPSGTPGTVIWTSPVQLISDSTYYSRKVWDISVPSIVVPDTFVWAVSVIQRNNNGLLESAFETASVGIANKVYFLDPTSGQWTVPFATLFAARVTAIPEPSTLALLGLGSLGLLVGSAFRHTTLRSGKLSCAHSDQNKLSRL